jgi:hypothetical protein
MRNYRYDVWGYRQMVTTWNAICEEAPNFFWASLIGGIFGILFAVGAIR